MAIHATRPSPDVLRALARQAVGVALTYSPVGISTMDPPPPGYRRDRWVRQLHGDDDVFERAVQALRTWRMHRGAGLVVEAGGPPTVGVEVAMAAPLPVGYVDVVCRVVDVIDEPDRYGFSYGTLPVHPEQGEESFTVIRDACGVVTFEIVAFLGFDTCWLVRAHPSPACSSPELSIATFRRCRRLRRPESRRSRAPLTRANASRRSGRNGGTSPHR